jgi:hypothetical protein
MLSGMKDRPSFRLRLARAAFLAPTLVALILPAPAIAGSIPDAWGWVVNRHPSVSHTPGALDMANSVDQLDRIKHLSPGSYRVLFKGIDNGRGGNAFVTAMTPTAHFCELTELARHPTTNDVLVFVGCFTRTGAPADTMFSLNFLSRGGDLDTSTLGYVWANDPHTSGGYAPDPFYAFVTGTPNPADGIIVYRNAVGRYRAGFAGIGSDAGNPQVVANFDLARCKLVSWFSFGPDEYVDVDCRTPAGDLVDTRFDVAFAVDVGLTGVAFRKMAYVIADQPSVPSYQPAVQSNNFFKVQSTVTRSAKGTYSVKLPGMPKGGSAQVTAVGTGKAACVLSSIRTVGLPQKVGVHCFNVNGDAVDAKFSLTYTR